MIQRQHKDVCFNSIQMKADWKGTWDM